MTNVADEQTGLIGGDHVLADSSASQTPIFKDSLVDGCVRFVNCIPPLLVCAVITWPWYVFTFINLPYIHHTVGIGVAIFLGVLVHIFLILALWSFVFAIFTAPGHVPSWYSQWELRHRTPEERDIILEGGVERKSDGSSRWCRKCRGFKPDRCHHCRVCSRCVLKMDHHCPWINNCVGYRNYKFFYLFTIYCLATCIVVIAGECPLYINSVSSNDKFHPGSNHFMIFFSFALTALILLTLFGFVGFHTYLLLRNFSTIELVEKKSRSLDYFHPWDLGRYDNIKQVLGPYPWLWFIPVRIGMTGNGVRFPATDASQHVAKGSESESGNSATYGRGPSTTNIGDAELRYVESGKYSNTEKSPTKPSPYRSTVSTSPADVRGL